MNRSGSHDDYTFITPAGAYSTANRPRTIPLTVVANSVINTNTANDLSPQDLLNVTAYTLWHSPDTPTLPLLPNLKGVCSHGHPEYTCEI